ncbi:MAG: NAD(P)/FAD-dependent oxidoreductase [Acidobacteria bacterium]|nr:NAD(P)/FAD-dependent oxidoreductase [Acidobacteriota bacterium]
MKPVAILGGGPAGATCAERLAAAGMKVVLFDEKLAWEKPCGGGITHKAYLKYPYLLENDTPKQHIKNTVLKAPKAGDAELAMEHPLLIYSRYELNDMLLRRASAAGAQLEKTRVVEIERGDGDWRIRTKAGTVEASFCVVATGARNPLRQVGTEFTAEDTMCALGYYVEGTRERIDIQFLPQFEGYIWVFPRCGHLSVGICGKGVATPVLRKWLEEWMTKNGYRWEGQRFYAHLIPSLRSQAFVDNRVAGEGWLAVGDAAGLVDPITGEGLYYAIRSGDLASQVLLNDGHAPAGKPGAYRELLKSDFLDDLYIASRLAHRFYTGNFVFGQVTDRMVQFVRRSETFRHLVRDLFSGAQPYTGLRERVWGNFRRSGWELVFPQEQAVPQEP